MWGDCMVRGVVMVNSAYFKPESLYPGHRVVYADGGYEFTSRLDIDEKIVVVFFEIPHKKVIENIKYPFIIYTQREPPAWLRKHAQVNMGKPVAEVALNRLLRGEAGAEDIEVLKANCYYVHMLIAQNIHKMYRKPPEDFGVLDKLVFSPDAYVAALTALLSVYKPLYAVNVAYNSRFYGNKTKGGR